MPHTPLPSTAAPAAAPECDVHVFWNIPVALKCARVHHVLRDGRTYFSFLCERRETSSGYGWCILVVASAATSNFERTLNTHNDDRHISGRLGNCAPFRRHVSLAAARAMLGGDVLYSPPSTLLLKGWHAAVS